MQDELITSARIVPSLWERLLTCWLVLFGWSELRIRASTTTEWEIGATGSTDWTIVWVPWWRGLMSRLRPRQDWVDEGSR